jgi:carboxymethylenebutenolidase
MNTLSKMGLFILFVVGLLFSVQLFAKEGATIPLKTKNGHSFQVYVNGPKDASRGILLIHGWWGLNDQVRSWADKFASLNYRVMAIDLYNGNVATTPDKARTYMNTVKQSEANKKFSASLEALQKPGRKLAIMGWSFGATQALQAALVSPEKISAIVMYYPFGKIIKSGNNVASLNGPILVIRAKLDSQSNIEETTHFIRSVKESGKSILEYTYDAKHGFANPSVKHYSAQASEAAWLKTTEFLGNHLK